MTAPYFIDLSEDKPHGGLPRWGGNALANRLHSGVAPSGHASPAKPGQWESSVGLGFQENAKDKIRSFK
ncbi:hypothetical protein CEXT_196371 [Caerostris extrusa]|uniref:Uncharacterized protein n=1 Tax=Caerostris extrusa TaxID=172846 RepID=A0AAV4M9T0_CAEEX|nr:hypothetical protein CEXT_196371 [Caerostris extrusa]